MNNWEIKRLNQVLNYEQPTKYIVESTYYDDEFDTPVLTAGKSFILGYTDETTGVFDNIPAIIFDDFTTAFHYVDFPFKVKSSAMKILKSDKDKDDLRFLYYQMSRLKVDTQLHKRYWISKFSKMEFKRPPLKTQQRIAQILDDAAALRDKTKQLLTEYDLLAQAIFLEMFGDPVGNPKSFLRVALDSIVNISSGSTPSRKIDSYWGGSIPWVKTGEVNSKLILDTEEKITEEGLKNSSCKLYPKGSILIAMYGQGKTRGQVAILGIDATTNQACAVLQPSDKINFTYLYEYLKLSYEDLRSLGRGGNQPNLNAGLINSYEVMNPPIELQNQFAEKINLIEQQKALAKQELQESEDLFNCLLQKAFKGELVFETA